MIKAPPEDAGIAYRDDLARVFEFYAMQHQFISSLARAGVHPKEQHLTRHSTIALTLDRHTHLHTADIAAVVEKTTPVHARRGRDAGMPPDQQ